MRIHNYPLQTGITPTPEFAKKGLACYGCNIGTKCGHGCPRPHGSHEGGSKKRPSDLCHVLPVAAGHRGLAGAG